MDRQLNQIFLLKVDVKRIKIQRMNLKTTVEEEVYNSFLTSEAAE